MKRSTVGASELPALVQDSETAHKVEAGLFEGGAVSLARKGRGPGERVLLAVFDLYKSIGGGQTSYRAIIENRPNDTFYYFIRNEARDARRPPNAFPIPYLEPYVYQQEAWAPSPLLALLANLLCDTSNLAASVRACLGPNEFDVIDVPDFHQYGVFIRPAMERHGIKVDRVALGLYGVLSNSFLSNWVLGTEDSFRARLKNQNVNVPFVHFVERAQYRLADVVYTCVGEPYQNRWRNYRNRPINFFDPMLCMRRPAPSVATASSGPVDLVFVGRREKIKGPDLFVDIAGWLDRSLIGSIKFVGPDGANSVGTGSETLTAMARRRHLELKFVTNPSDDELREIYRGRALVLLPSRFDTLNFVALDALSMGCPTIVSNRAGVAWYLRAHQPRLPASIIDIDCSRSAASVVSNVIENYDWYRDSVIKAIEHDKCLTADATSIFDIYKPSDRVDDAARVKLSDLDAHLMQFQEPRGPRGIRATVKKVLKAKLPAPVKRKLAPIAHNQRQLAKALHPRNITRTLRNVVREQAKRFHKVEIATLGDEVINSKWVPATHVFIAKTSERSDALLEKKIAILKQQASQKRVNRASIYRELARLERRTGRPLVAVAYQLRIIRWLGRDHYGDLANIVTTLEENGYTREAETAKAMYTPGINNEAACLELLHRRFDELKTLRRTTFEFVDDRRGATEPTVSIIVSLFRAASKLDAFLGMIAQDQMLRAGKAELVLVDSGSPTDERVVFERFMTGQSFSVVYARSAERETIQSAWNRGIELARGKYLTFLGVDEAIPAHATTVLANHLDRAPDLDWVVSDTIVTNVDRHKIHVSDVMRYDRSTFQQWSHYLDCTYLNYVGCMYRRSIHDRFGYYDATFWAAGDNEFKNRVLPHIKCGYIPRFLGIFNNYPEERATQSPRAELEELRSWYLHRTTAGMKYAIRPGKTEMGLDLLAATLRYQKCYLENVVSTDFDLANSLAQVLQDQSPAALASLGEFQRILEIMQCFERIDINLIGTGSKRDGNRVFYNLVKLTRELRSFTKNHQTRFAIAEPLQYGIFNDNRHQQHSWTW